MQFGTVSAVIVALRNENGSYNPPMHLTRVGSIVALRNENGSYNFNLFFNLIS